MNPWTPPYPLFQVVTAVMKAFESIGGELPGLPEESSERTRALSKRILLAVADDDGTAADLDFPEVRRMRTGITDFTLVTVHGLMSRPSPPQPIHLTPIKKRRVARLNRLTQLLR